MIQNFYRNNRDLKQMSKSTCMALEEIMKHYKLLTNYLTESSACMFQPFPHWGIEHTTTSVYTVIPNLWHAPSG
jgi:hypothetical protein